MKYIKLFEGFESVKISKTLNFIKDKRRFLEELTRVCNDLEFPMSNLKDEYFQYLPFKKALAVNKEPIEIRCDADNPYIDDEYCEDGKIRKPGGGKFKTVDCPDCNGTGFKMDYLKGEIGLIKFWFSKEGELIETSAVDGNLREQVDGNSIDNPYCWNAILSGDWFRCLKLNNVEQQLKGAHFALVLNIQKLKESGYQSRVSIRDERENRKRNTLAMKNDEEIRQINISKYLNTLADNFKITPEMKNITGIFPRIFGYNNCFAYIFGNLNMPESKEIVNNIYAFLRDDKYREVRASNVTNILRDLYNSNGNINKNIDRSIKYAMNKFESHEEQYCIDLLNTLLDIGKIINEKLLRAPVTCLDDLEVKNQKIRAIANFWKDCDDRFPDLRKIYYFTRKVNNWKENEAYGYLSDVDEEEANKMMNQLNSVKNIIDRIIDSK